MNQTDEQLMMAYQAGDEESFRQLFARYSERVYAYLLKRTQEPEEAEEVSQKVWVKLHTSRSRYDSKYLFVQWIFVIARSVSLDHFRTAQKSPEVRIENEEVNQIAIAEDLQSDHEEFEELLSDLSWDQKALLKMSNEEDLTFEEMARVLKKSEVSLRQSVSRILKKLRKGAEV